MAQVFVFNAASSEGMDTTELELAVSSYWGTDPEILFIAHYSHISRLIRSGGYVGVRVIDIEDPKEVTVEWLPFSKSEENEYRSKDTNDYFFFYNDSIIDYIFSTVLDPDPNNKLLILKIIKTSNNELGTFCIGGKIGDPGAGGTTPTAGAKLP